MPEPESDLALLLDAAAAAGKIAGTFFGQDPAVFDKGVEGPVTEADLAIDAMLHEVLLGARPDYGWLSEETEDSHARLDAEHVFICDPIDGTRAFIEGQRSFSHSLAVARGGEITAAVVFLPMLDKLYAAAKGNGAMLNGASVSVSDAVAPEDSTVLATKGCLTAINWPRGVPAVMRTHRPSLAYRMSLVGEGRFDGMMTFRKTWEWDIAAGTLIIAEAGGVVTDANGGPLRFNGISGQVDGVLAGAPGLHGALIALRG